MTSISSSSTATTLGLIAGAAAGTLLLAARKRNNSSKKLILSQGKINNLETLTLKHSSGSQVIIYKHGGTIASWTLPNGKEMLLLSKNAVFNGKKAIRGGIPLVFPQFGPGKLPNHGFARTSEWNTNSLKNNILILELKDNEETRKLWNHQFQLFYEIELNAKSLRTKLIVKNTGKSDFEFQALLHTYYKVPDIKSTFVKGLKGSSFMDKLKDGKVFNETRKQINFTEETDRIYMNAPSMVTLPGIAKIEVQTSGKDHDIVVWNPHIAKSKRMGDFGDDEWKNMVCIEPGYVAKWKKLTADETFELEQNISSSL